MKKNLFTFVERNDSNKQFENHLCASVLAQIFGGGNHANSVTKVDDNGLIASWGGINATNERAAECLLGNVQIPIVTRLATP